MSKSAAIPAPRESVEQTRLFQWAHLAMGKYPELALMYHIPNGGSRHKLEAAHLKAQGVRAGVPDICLPVARGPYHGLYIELKREDGGKLSATQSEWLDGLDRQGYRAVCCHGWERAAEEIQQYMEAG